MTKIKLPEGVCWVGAGRSDGFSIETSYFKTVSMLEKRPENAVIQISANTRYILYINGHELL